MTANILNRLKRLESKINTGNDGANLALFFEYFCGGREGLPPDIVFEHKPLEDLTNALLRSSEGLQPCHVDDWGASAISD